jgi:hypothetical protein
LGIAVVALMSASCSGSTDEPTPTAVASSPDPSVSETPSVVESQVPGPYDVIGEGTPLDPGLYTYRPFRPGVTFRVDDGWEGGHTNPSFFDVWQEEEVFVGFIAPTFLDLGGGEHRATGDLDARKVVDLVAARRGLEVTEAVPTQIGGAAGYRIDVASAREGIEVLGIEGEEGALSAPPGWFLRWAPVDVGGALVVVMVGIRGERDPVAMAEAQVVVNSVRWGPPAADIEVEGEPLVPGRYTNPDFTPTVSFEVGEGWAGGHQLSEFFDVTTDDGTLVGFAHPSFLIDGDGEEIPVAGLDAGEAAAILAEREELDATDPRPVRLGGVGGFAVDATPRRQVDVFGGPEGTLTLAGEEFHHFQFVEVHGELALAVVIIRGEYDDSTMQAVEQILETVRWGPV